MDFLKFKDIVAGRPLFSGRDIVRETGGGQALRNQIVRWQKRGLLIPLKKGFYTLRTSERRVECDPRVVARMIYPPSYISLETALSFYDMIPERVVEVTSLTTLKTASFQTALGRFTYRHIKPEAFSGFTLQEVPAGTFFLAGPEKAVVDFIYFNLKSIAPAPREALENSYRFQNMEDLASDRILESGRLFDNAALMRVLTVVAAWVGDMKS